MKKISTLIITALILSMALSGCGKKAREQAAKEAEARAAAEQAAAEAQQRAKAAETTAQAAQSAQEQAQQQLQEVSAQLETAGQNMKKLQAEREQLEQKVTAAEQQLGQMKDQLQQMEQMKTTLTDIKKEVTQSQDKLKTVQGEKAQLESKVQSLTQQRDEAMGKLQQLEQQNQSLQQQINELRQMLEDQKKKVGKAANTGKAIKETAAAPSAPGKKSEPALTESKSPWEKPSTKQAAPQTAYAPDEPMEMDTESELTKKGLEFDISMDYVTHYIWRGQKLNESSFQPAAAVRWGNLTAAFWGNVALTNSENHQWEFTETDWSLDYTDKVPGLEKVYWSVGSIYYNFGPTATPDTWEIYWGFSFDVPLSPYIMVYHDLDEADGMYINSGVSYAWENVFQVAPDMPTDLELSASMGWGDGGYNKYYWSGVDDDGLNDFNLSLAMPTDCYGWTLTPSLNWTMIVDNALRDTNTYSDSNNYFWVGVGLSRTF